MQSRSAGLDGRLPRPAAVGLDTLAILKVGTAATGATLDEREKEYETNPISHNPQGINGLQLVSSTAGRPAQQDLTDRSTGIRGDLDLSPIAQASAGRFAETCGPVGLDTLAILKGGDSSATAGHARRSRKNETNPISHNPRGINGLWL